MAESCFSILWKLETTDPRISIRYPKQDDEAIHIYRHQGIPCAKCFKSRNEVFKAAKEKNMYYIQKNEDKSWIQFS